MKGSTYVVYLSTYGSNFDNASLHLHRHLTPRDRPPFNFFYRRYQKKNHYEMASQDETATLCTPKRLRGASRSLNRFDKKRLRLADPQYVLSMRFVLCSCYHIFVRYWCTTCEALATFVPREAHQRVEYTSPTCRWIN